MAEIPTNMFHRFFGSDGELSDNEVGPTDKTTVSVDSALTRVDGTADADDD